MLVLRCHVETQSPSSLHFQTIAFFARHPLRHLPHARFANAITWIPTGDQLRTTSPFSPALILLLRSDAFVSELDLSRDGLRLFIVVSDCVESESRLQHRDQHE
jgi:hypothetical protein